MKQGLIDSGVRLVTGISSQLVPEILFILLPCYLAPKLVISIKTGPGGQAVIDKTT